MSDKLRVVRMGQYEPGRVVAQVQKVVLLPAKDDRPSLYVLGLLFPDGTWQVTMPANGDVPRVGDVIEGSVEMSMYRGDVSFKLRNIRTIESEG